LTAGEDKFQEQPERDGTESEPLGELVFKVMNLQTILKAGKRFNPGVRFFLNFRS
jgi:hypothetical protein